MNSLPRIVICQRKLVVRPFYWNVIRLTSYGPPPSTPPKPGSLTYKYENFLGRWPKVLAMHRTIVDGEKKLKDLEVPQLEVLVQMSSEAPKLTMVTVLLPLPFAFYVFALAVIFFPRLVLTRHFWSDRQRREYFQLEVTKSLVNGEQLVKSLGNPRKPEDLSSKEPSALALNEKYLLQALHSILLLPGSERRLKARINALRQLDAVLPAVIDDLTERQLVFHTYIRRLNIGSKSEEQLRKSLKDYIKYVSKLDDTAYLYAPVFINRA
ncbi:unnamed protein product [Caenorhabditis auriculariae]|uniref:Letm1 RBD domain-containing protein n=1 Tax=Caenorhabditis auriculariae TaxID=2777116 RepID=A0A8S1H8M9_9PELO|nr:unnamed protein product [Caenorhabditis auriculariae]